MLMQFFQILIGFINATLNSMVTISTNFAYTLQRSSIIVAVMMLCHLDPVLVEALGPS